MKFEKVVLEGITEMKCSKTGKVLPISEFRLHSKGYYLSYSKEWEKADAKRRREAKSKKASTVAPVVITITTPKGKVFTAHTEPVIGGRKAESPKTDITLYFEEGVTRDEVRSAFRAHTGVPMTGIKAAKVTD